MSSEQFDIKTIGDLRRCLNGLDDNVRVGLSVYRHSNVVRGHGYIHAAPAEIHFANIEPEKILLLFSGGWPDSGYEPTQISFTEIQSRSET